MLLALLQAADAAPNWNEDVIAKATIVIAVATVISVITTLLLWLTTRQSVRLTREIYEAAHRPYVGAVTIYMDDGEDGGDGGGDDEEGSETPESITFIVELKNVGSVPARDLTYTLRVSVDGHILPDLEAEEEKSAALFPGVSKFGHASTDDPREIELIQQAKAISLLIKCTYKGVGEQTYAYEEKATYSEKSGQFVSVKATFI